ncbi:hypothetical protein CR513_32210, partial [Mucuna pruriens]
MIDQDPNIHLQAFQTQVYISGGVCKLFPTTLRGVAMQWFVSLPPRTIHTFNDLTMIFVSQFAAKGLRGLTSSTSSRQRGLRTRKFSDPFALRHPFNMGDIRAKAEKNTEAKEDQVCHTQLLDIPLPIGRRIGPSPDEWCEFHHTNEHTANGHLGHFVQGRDEPKSTIVRTKNNTRSRDRSQSRRLTLHRGTITTIVRGGATESMSKLGRRRYV